MGKGEISRAAARQHWGLTRTVSSLCISRMGHARRRGRRQQGRCCHSPCLQVPSKGNTAKAAWKVEKTCRSTRASVGAGP
jgi:hypothetical protein